MANRQTTNDIISRFSAQDQGLIATTQKIRKELAGVQAQSSSLRSVLKTLETENQAGTRSYANFEKALGQSEARAASLSAKLREQPAYIKAVARELNNLGTQSGHADKKVGGLFSQMAGGGSKLQDIGRGIASTTASLPLMTGMFVAAGLVVGDFAKTSVANFLELEQAVANIASIKPEIDTSGLFDQLSDLQTRVPATAKDLAEAYYNIASSIELSEEQTLALLEKTARGAVAARTSQERWAAAVIGQMNAYGQTLADVDHVQDVFFLTIRNGVVTGDQLAASWGRLAQAGKNAGLSFEELAALTAAVTKQGGAAEQNLNDLFNVLQKVVTSEAGEKLASLGVRTQTATGDFRDLTLVLYDLDAALRGMSEGQRAQALQDIFPDLQARQAANVLLNQLQEISENYRDMTTQSGEASRAFDRQMDTNAARLELMSGKVRSLQEESGRAFLTIGAGIFDMLDGVTNALNDLHDSPNWQRIRALMNIPAGTQASNFDAEFQKQLAIQQELSNATSVAANKFRDAHETMRAEMGGTGKSFAALAHAHQQSVSASNAALGQLQIGYAQLADATRAYADAVSGAFDEPTTAYEQYLATVEEAAKGVELALQNIQAAEDALVAHTVTKFADLANMSERELTRLENRLARIANIKVDLPTPLTEDEFFQETIENQRKQAEYNERFEEAQKRAGVITETTREREARLAAERAQNARESYEDTVRSIENSRTLKAAQDALTSSTERYRNELAALRDQLEENKRIEEAEVSALGIMAKKAELEKYARDSEIALRAMNDELERTRDELERIREAASTFLAPFQQAVTSAGAVLDALRERGRAVNEIFDEVERGVRRAIAAIEAEERRVLGALDNEIRALRDTLYELAQEHERQIRPINDAIYDQERVVRDLDAAVRAVAASYDRDLLPLQKELNELNREAAEIDASRRLNDQRVQVQNLAAALQRLTPGTAEYIETQRRLGEAQQDLSIEGRRQEIEGEIRTIEEAKQAAVDAAQARADAAREELEALRARAEEINRQYELDRRETEDALARKERERELRAREFDERKAVHQEELRQLEEQRDRFNEMQRERERAAEATLQDARVTLASMEAIAEAQVKQAEARLKGLQEQYDTAERVRQDRIDDFNNQLYELGILEEAIRARHKVERDEIDAGILAVQGKATEVELAGKREVEAIQRTINKLNEEKLLREAIARLAATGQAGAPPSSGPRDAHDRRPPPPPRGGRFSELPLVAAPMGATAYAPVARSQSTVVYINAPVTVPFNARGMVTRRDHEQAKQFVSRAVREQMDTIRGSWVSGS